MEQVRDQRYDLTQGGIFRKLLIIALPIMGTQLMQMMYNLTDMFWLGRVGSDAVAASGTAGMFLWLSMAFVMIGRMGAEIGVSQNLGQGNSQAAQSFASNACRLALMLGTAFALILILLRGPLVSFFAIPEAHVVLATERYLAIVGAGVPFSFLTSALVGCFNASGNARMPFFVNALGLVVNMVLDPLFIFGLGMGIEGAAIATVLAQGIASSVMLLAMKHGAGRPFERFRLFAGFDRATVLRILRWTLPLCMESLFFTSMAMITTRFIAVYGAGAIAATRVSGQIESLSWLIGGGFGSAMTAFMGQNYGAGKWSRIHKGFVISVRAMSIWGLVVTALLFWGGEFLFALFLPDPEIVAIGALNLRILAVCQLPQCFEGIAGGSFKGMGRTFPPTLVSMSANVVRVILAYFLSRTSLGLLGVWWGITLAAVLRGTWGFVWYALSLRKQPRVDLLSPGTSH